MRTIEEIKADMKKPCDYTDTCEFTAELILALTADIPLSRLEELCQAEREKRCIVFPCMKGDTINSLQFSEDKGLHIVSDEVTQVLQTKKGFTIQTKKMFYPIKTDEYDVAPISEYPNALADFYIGTREAAEAALKGEAHE